MTQQTAFFPLGGGMDLITPMLSMPPGRVIASLNYEPVASGYKRLRGFERFNGMPSPSEAIAYSVTYDANGTGAFTRQLLVGDIIRDTASGTIIGYAAENAVLLSGTWNAATGVGRAKIYIPPASLAAWVDDNQFFVGATHYGYQQGEETALTSASDQALAAAQARALITLDNGQGPILGLHAHNGRVYQVRLGNSGLADTMRYSSSTGWVAVDFGDYVTFTSGGTTELVEGDAITNSSGGASLGEISRIILTSGSWAGGDAAGRIYGPNGFNVFSGGNTIYKAGQVTDLGTVTNVTNVTLPPNGDYYFLNHNFFGAENKERIYFTSGTTSAIEYDPMVETGSPILTGTVPDTPTRIAEHRESLFLAFEGGSVQFSTPGEPISFDPITGAGEIIVGTEITNFIPASQGALAILGETRISILYGNDSSDYQLETLSDDSGAHTGTAQRIGQVVYMDDRGLRTLDTTAAYGNFRIGSISTLIEPLLEDLHHDGVSPSASVVLRHRNQYWLFFDNGTGLVVHFGRKQAEIMPFNLGVTVTKAVRMDDDGDERIFIGCTNGFVYELDRGTSFDGAAIEHYVRVPFNHFGKPQYKKLVKKALIDLEASGTTTIEVTAEYDLGSVPGSSTQPAVLTTGGAAIDGLGSNEQYYASQIETQAEVYLDGLCLNVSVKIGGNTSSEEPHTLTGMTYYVLPRGMDL